jgi:hypothetical protein
MSDPAKQYVAPATEQRVVMKDIFWLGSFQLNRSSAYSAWFRPVSKSPGFLFHACKGKEVQLKAFGRAYSDER